LIPDNLPCCKEAYKKWIDLGSVGHRYKCWKATNDRIDNVNELALQMHIQKGNPSSTFIPIQHIDEEEYQHLASYIWQQASGHDTIDYSQDYITLCSKGHKEAAVAAAKSQGILGISGVNIPNMFITDEENRTKFYKMLTAAYCSLLYSKDKHKFDIIIGLIEQHQIYKSEFNIDGIFEGCTQPENQAEQIDGAVTITVEIKPADNRKDVDSRAFVNGEPIQMVCGDGTLKHLGQISSSAAWAKHDMLYHFKDRYDELYPQGWELKFIEI
jgi:rhodanese-related sulfurtransferase